MSLLRIFKAQNVNEVESHLDDLQSADAPSLQLPVKLKTDSIGGEAALIQLVITWAKRNPEKLLVTHVQQSHDPDVQLKRLTNTGFGFVACLMSKEIVTLDESKSLSRVAYDLASKRVDKMCLGPKEALHGHRILLASVDHSTKWRLPPFYFSDGSVRGRKEFYRLAETLIAVGTKSIAPGMAREWLRQLPVPTYDGLGTIIHELFKNTHDWARTSSVGVPLRRSVRGILVSTRNLEFSAIQEAAKGSAPLEQYVRHRDFVGTDGRFRCLEISIFDSGPGLASRWLGEPLNEGISLEQEYTACIECLQKHRSTSGRSHKGIGLYEVVRTLSPLQGFARLRTGRLALYRDFVKRPLSESEHEGASHLDDWETCSSDLKKRASVEGSLFTMLIPLTFGGA